MILGLQGESLKQGQRASISAQEVDCDCGYCLNKDGDMLMEREKAEEGIVREFCDI